MKSLIPKKTIDKLILTTIIILSSILIILILTNFTTKKETHKFEIIDDCSNILGNIISDLNNPDTCKIRCIENCKIKKMEFLESKFTPKTHSCNECLCTCIN